MFLSYRVKLLFSFIIFSFAFVLAAKALLLPYLPDFVNYYYGAKHVVQNDTPYVLDNRYFTGQSYPPFTLLLFIPFTYFSLETASKVWTLSNLIIVIMCLWLIYKMNKESFFSPQNLFLSTLVFLSFPLKFSLGMGQINCLILLLLTVAVYYFNKKQYLKTGFFLAFPLMIKFFPLLLLPYSLILRKKKLVMALLITLFLSICITYVFFSTSAINHYFTQILPNLLTSWKGDYYNQSVTGFVMRTVQDQALRQMLRAFIAGVLLLCLIVVFIKEKRNDSNLTNLKISAIITLTLLINSFSWQHHFIWLSLPFFLMYFFIKKQKRNKKYFFLLGISYLLVAVNAKNPTLLPVYLQSHVFYGALILYFLNLFLIVKYKVYFLKKK